MRRTRTRRFALVATLLVPAAGAVCAGGDVPPPATFGEAFREARRVILEEPAGAPLGDLQALAVGGGRWAVIDAQASELRLHDPHEGRLVRRPGTPGRGPGELRVPRDVAVHGGIAWVADAGAPELTGFALGGDSTRTIEIPGGTAKRVLSTPGGLLVGTTDRSEPRFTLIDPDAARLVRRLVREDSATLAIPYWGALVDHPAAALGDRIVTAMNLRYPLWSFGGAGEADTLGRAPASWVPARVPEYGEFAGMEGQVRLLDEYLSSFTTIDRLDALGDVLLVSHGGFERRAGPGVPFRNVQRMLDAYASNGAKLWEDVAPPGRILHAADDTLYVLIDEPPAGWTIGLFTRRR